MKTAVVAGATGLVGRALVHDLLDDKRYSSVIALTRRPVEQQHPRLVNLLTDFSDLTAVLRGHRPDDVFCCLGTTMAKARTREAFYQVDFQFPLELARVTRALGARQYLLVSALGASKGSLIYYNRVKGEVEEAIAQIGFEATHIFRPSLLLGARTENRPGEDAAKWLYKIFAFAIPARYKSIRADLVAANMVAQASQDLSGIFIHESREMRTASR